MHMYIMFDIKKEPLKLYALRLLDRWCPDSELNQGHRDFQSLALPTELSGHIVELFEKKIWWAIGDLNPGPAGYEPDALTN